MNNRSDLLHRLLKLFPVDLVKEEYGLTGKSSEVITEIILTKSEAQIHKFAAENINYTRQHIYIFDIKPKYDYKTFNLDEFPFPFLDGVVDRKQATIHCLPIVDFDVVIITPFEEDTIRFFQPLKITVTDSHVTIQITTLEKNLSHYFGQGKRVVDVVRKNGEDELVSKIVGFFIGKGFSISPSDLHKGIKFLWKEKVIDPKYVKAKKSKSTDTINMDEDYTVREVYPAQYDEMINKPLLKTIWKYKGDEEGLFCDHFSVDPLNGFIGIASFPANKEQINNIINEIISNN